MTRPFIIYALPRSRTAWLSKFLTYGDWKCGHDIVTDYFTPESLQHALTAPNFGTVETGMAEGWKLARRLVPNAKVVVIKRSSKDVIASLNKAGLEFSARQIIERAAALDEVALQQDVLTFYYEELENECACKKIFEWCLGIPFDRDWWLGLRNANIQIDLPQRIHKLRQNHNNLASLRRHYMEAMV